MDLRPKSLQGDHITLAPLSPGHVPDLALIGKDREIWRYLPYGDLTDEIKMGAHVRRLLKNADRGTDLPFAVLLNETGAPIGCTRFLAISALHRRLEIGGTWFGVAYQRTKANTESKYLLLTYAFEQLGCRRVQFKTSPENRRSQQALERIGAVREGVLRNHMILPDGASRDSVFYSIVSTEWPAVKRSLTEKMK